MTNKYENGKKTNDPEVIIHEWISWVTKDGWTFTPDREQRDDSMTEWIQASEDSVVNLGDKV